MTGGLAGFDWASDGFWLALLFILVFGLGLPHGLTVWLDRWLVGRRTADTVALATRYGGFMNSWAVFGRGAIDYRDLRPLFPSAAAAELARFEDGTACMAVRFPDSGSAGFAATEHFSSFAASGIEFQEAGLSFQAADAKSLARGGYARGQWIVVGDTLLAFYGASSDDLRRRRRYTPCLIERPLPSWGAQLISRRGYSLLAALWILLTLALATPLLERAARQSAPAGIPPMALALIEARLAELGQTRGTLAAEREGPGQWVLRRRVEEPGWADWAALNGKADAVGAVRLRLDAARGVAAALILAGVTDGVAATSGGMLPPRQWLNLAGLGELDSVAPEVAMRLAQMGWGFEPRLWPFSLP